MHSVDGNDVFGFDENWNRITRMNHADGQSPSEFDPEHAPKRRFDGSKPTQVIERKNTFMDLVKNVSSAYLSYNVWEFLYWLRPSLFPEEYR